MRHFGPRLPASALRRLWARQAGGVLLQTARLLSVLWRPPYGADCGTLGRSRPGERPAVPVRQWVLSLPIPLRLLLAAQPQLLTPVLRVVHRVLNRFLLDQVGLTADEADGGAVTLIQRFGSAANLNIHLHCLVLDGVYRRGADREPQFVGVPAPTDEAVQAVLHKIITRMMKLLTRQGVLIEEQGEAYLAAGDDSDESSALQRHRPSGVDAKVTVARRHHAPGDVAAGVHAAPGRVGA